MRCRLTVRLYNNTLSNAFKSMESHFLLRDIFFFINTVRLHICISGGDRQGFHGDMIIIIRVFHIYFATVK